MADNDLTPMTDKVRARAGGTPTLADVAREARVSPKTVSRVVNRERYVRPETQAAVAEAIARLGYVPNRAARELAGSRSFVIAMFFGNVNSNYMTDLLLSAAEACRAVGYHLTCEPIDQHDESTAVLDQAIASIRPDGIILLPPFADRPMVLETIERAGIPVARIASVEPGYGHRIAVDEEPVSRVLVEHLIARGHRRIGIVAPRPDQLVASGRLRGYRAALAGAGIALDPALEAPGTFLFDSGVRGGDQLLDLADPPTAIFGSNDETALGVIYAARRRGIDVPGQLAVAGFDDSNASRMGWPPLTTVRQPLDHMAAMAVALLLDEPYRGPPLQHQLLLRLSTGD